MSIRVIINGAQGKMGAVTVKSIANQKDLELVGVAGSKDDLGSVIREKKADVVIDFTTPQNVFETTKTIIKNHARPVVGTTGLTQDQIKILMEDCKQARLGGIIAPNFSIGGILMMKCAEECAPYFQQVEIIEMHHPQKKDSPSGTAIKTAQMIEANSAAKETFHGVPIHSVRLSGLFAHHIVLFGGEGETLTIRHDAMDRNAMMPGVFLACRKVMELDHLVYGLENVF